MVAREIQLEWISFQCMTKYLGQEFEGLEKFLRETFLTHILFEKSKTLSPVEGAQITLPLKKTGMGLHNPVKLAAEK